jgi:hypothetical protein
MAISTHNSIARSASVGLLLWRHAARRGIMGGMNNQQRESVPGFFRPIALAMLLILPTYVFSFGPACWLTSQVIVGGWVEPHPAMRIYWPLGAIANNMRSQCGEYVRWWMTLGIAPGHSAIVPTTYSDGPSLAVRR